MAENEQRFDKEAVRARIAMPQLCEQLGIALRHSGGRWVGCCPFHAERTGSFTVTHEDKAGWHFHCFGCAAHGDIFDLWTLRQGGDFKAALKALAGIAGLGPMPSGWKPQRPRKEFGIQGTVSKAGKMIRFPKVRRLSDATCEELAGLRGLSVAGVMAARDAGMVWGAELGISERSGVVWGEALASEGDKGRLRVGPVRSWIVNDGAGMAMQARRLDGEKWTRYDGGAYKGHTFGTAKWPLGARLIGERRRVALVEGGPDILAAYHFLAIAGRLHAVAVVGVLGASVRLHPEALPFFAHKRVRIFAHLDKEDPKNGKRAGWEAAAKWQDELTEAGAEVDVWDFSDLLQADGRPVGDLNDAARGDEECLREMAPAMNFNPSIFDTDGK
jgi:hypothetical protein